MQYYCTIVTEEGARLCFGHDEYKYSCIFDTDYMQGCIDGLDHHTVSVAAFAAVTAPNLRAPGEQPDDVPLNAHHHHDEKEN